MALLSRTGDSPRTGIVHFGLGAFHRAHQAVYTEDAMAVAGGDWGIAAVAPRSADVVTALQAQDRLYSVTSVSARGNETRVIGAFSEVHRAAADPDAVVARLADPAVRVVTLTITEKGYHLDPVDGRLLAAGDLAADLETDRPPRTVPGLLVRGLAARRRADAGPIAVVSCDTVPSNGRRTRDLVRQAVMHHDRPGLLDWINEQVTFPGTMADRIVPATTPAVLAVAERALGCTDRAAVHAEPYSNWVIEDDFPGGRPAWDLAGASFTDDTSAWERLKLRALNGTHSGIAYLGALAGCPTVSAALQMPGLREVMSRFLVADVAPSLIPPDGITAGAYGRQVLDRFANPAIEHRTVQIARDGSQKLPQRLLHTIADRRAAGAEPRWGAMMVAAWMRYTRGRADDGSPLPLDDPLADEIRARQADLLTLRAVFPQSLAEDEVVRRLIDEWLASFDKHGVAATVAGAAT
ncbi:mannitol dehydrogenase family protein [Actinoplanes sp. NPDC051633]|uniref:mannitol dehydrogenase family protein n=1 Tax=Actinoplanes sp. NPDC051633 TaxID=3155670 RepID=UPI00343BF3F3